MASPKSHFLCLALVLFSFFFLTTSTFAQDQKPKEVKLVAEADVKASPVDTDSDTDGFKAVNDFCTKRKTMEDRTFCKKVLKSNPKSAIAKDDPTLLKIAIELAVANAKRTHEFFDSLLKINDTEPTVKAALPPCLTAYDNSVKQLNIIGQDLEDDPPMASFDARMAAEQLNLCDKTLITAKITEPSILSRNKIAVKYSELVEELSNAF